jgi:hypothetical protein
MAARRARAAEEISLPEPTHRRLERNHGRLLQRTSNIFLPNARKVNGQLKSAIAKITVKICMITDGRAGLARARNFAAGLKPENGIPVTPVSARKSSSNWREEAK